MPGIQLELVQCLMEQHSPARRNAEAFLPSKSSEVCFLRRKHDIQHVTGRRMFPDVERSPVRFSRRSGVHDQMGSAITLFCQIQSSNQPEFAHKDPGLTLIPRAYPYFPPFLLQTERDGARDPSRPNDHGCGWLSRTNLFKSGDGPLPIGVICGKLPIILHDSIAGSN